MGCKMTILNMKNCLDNFIHELKIVGSEPSYIGYYLYTGKKTITHRLPCVLNFLIFYFKPLSLQIAISHSYLICF